MVLGLAPFTYLQHFPADPEWGTFIQPDKNLEQYSDPKEGSGVTIFSGIKADISPFIGQNAAFDVVANKILSQIETVSYEEQCSGKYYYDMFTCIQKSQPRVERIVEVGVYLGGASCFIAGCIENTETDLHLLDLNKDFLLYAYERIRRLYPKVAERTKLFFGDLATYVHNVMIHENKTHIIQHDGSHFFNAVVRDLSSLYYVKDKLHTIMIQDTNLRTGNINSHVFVDMALHAVFGNDFQFTPLGVTHTTTFDPCYKYNRHGTYFIPDLPEGMAIPFPQTRFHYPHPSTNLETFMEGLVKEE